MNELIHGATAILDGLKYHAKNYLDLQNSIKTMNIFDLEQDTNLRDTVDTLNHEAVAYFNRIGQFYYFARSEKVAEILDDFQLHIPNVLRLKVFRMKQSAHRATDAPRGENSGHMEQLDRLFTYQFLLFNKKLLYQILLDEPDPITSKRSVNFWMHEDHPKLVAEIENFIVLINTE